MERSDASRGAAEKPLVLVPSARDLPYLVDVMTRRQKRHLRLLVCCWILAELAFWTWWLQHGHVVTWAGIALNSVLFLWTTYLAAWYMFFVLRMKEPNPVLGVPDGRVAMIVTKAPSEPWPVLEKTLLGMLAQRFPGSYDVWLADEDPSPETIAWCAAHGVSISCRKGVAAYQNKRWPGREKCKEGNLRYFYEVMGGYDRYDFVAQFDADQVPNPDYLAEVIRPFNDPAVGYVAAPSICDNNADRSWSARGRLYVEASWHGPVQAGYNDGFAPQCIGSHYAVRTRALREIGGLGPELAEDFSTTLMMNAHGWRGAFAWNAIAHGDGPVSITDCLVQEFQWSRSIVRVMLIYSFRYWKRLPLHLMIKFAFCEGWYPRYTLHMLAVYLLPVIAILTDTPWVRVSLPEFILFASLPMLAGLAVIRFTRKNGWLRPTYAPILSWEAALFQFTRWPWMLAGVLDAVLGSVLGRESTFRVTNKGKAAEWLPWILVVPNAAIVLAETGALLLGRDVERASGYVLLAIVNVVTYTVVIVALPLLHLAENRPAGSTFWSYQGRYLPRMIPVVASLALLLVSVLMLQGPRALTALMPPAPSTAALATPEPGIARISGTPTADVASIPAAVPGPPAVASGPSAVTPSETAPATPTMSVAEVPGGRSAPTREATAPLAVASPVLAGSPTVLAFGLPADRLSFGAYDPHWQLANLSLDVEHWYIRQDDPPALSRALVSARNRRTPLVTIEPFPSPGQTEPVLDLIAAGAKDEDLRALARVVVASRPQVVLVRWGHEMDISGLYPWGANAPEIYQAAYRHIVEVFRTEGATNVRWVWSPAGHAGAADFYPGDDVVDYVGLTVLGDEGWDATSGLPPQSFAQLLGPRYNRVAGFGKPIMIAELAVSGSTERQGAWLADAVRSLDEFPQLRCLVYFYDRNPATSRVSTQPEWRVPSEILEGFLVAVRGPPAADR
jgi:cellulose synthase/poly-beta-1,6-N-acetylglucosamine synthase-like glycosyltransferase